MTVPIHFSPLVLVGSAVIGLISALLARKRGRNPYAWFAIGFLFGIFGIFAIFFASSKKKQVENPPQLQPIYTIHGPSDKFWYYLDAKHEQHGPMSKEGLIKAWQEGKVSPSTYVWHEEMTDWKPLREKIRAECGV